MIIISDTGPLNYLLRIEAIDVLPQLYHSVLIPEAVRQEMLHPNAPENVRVWAERPPEWVTIRQPQFLLSLPLGAGETAAISLAVEAHINDLLIDERRGRQAAQAQGLQVIGTLGILFNAAQLGLLNFMDAVTRLRQAGFHISEEVIHTVLGNQASE